MTDKFLSFKKNIPHKRFIFIKLGSNIHINKAICRTDAAVVPTQGHILK
jgi:hypothetical protein